MSVRYLCIHRNYCTCVQLYMIQIRFAFLVLEKVFTQFYARFYKKKYPEISSTSCSDKINEISRLDIKGSIIQIIQVLKIYL